MAKLESAHFFKVQSGKMIVCKTSLTVHTVHIMTLFIPLERTTFMDGLQKESFPETSLTVHTVYMMTSFVPLKRTPFMDGLLRRCSAVAASGDSVSQSITLRETEHEKG